MKRIIVLGKNRSGTKYLTNLIAQKFELSCIQSEDHDGVVESNIYSNYQKIFKDNLTPENKRAILCLLSCDALFLNSKVSIEELMEFKWDSILELERLLFDQNAIKEKNLGWVHKAESLSSKYFANSDLLKIFIERKPSDIFMSTLKLKKFNLGQKLIICLKISLSSHIENYYRKKFNALQISYEDLLEDKENVLKKIEKYIGVPIGNDDENLIFNNSTFKNKKRIVAKKWLGFVFGLQKTILHFIPIYVVLMINNYYLNRPFQSLITKTIIDPINGSSMKDKHITNI